MDTAKYYTSIVDLPLSKFIDCLVDGNLYALVISGEADKDALRSLWDTIIQEYNDEMGDKEGQMYWRVFKEVNTWFGNIGIIKVCIELLKCRYRKEDADDLNRLVDAKFKFDVNDPVNYRKELDRCEKRAKHSELMYEIKKAELAAIEKKMIGEKREKPDRKYFAKLLVTLMENSNGIRLTASEITTYEFCERVRRFGEHIKNLESQTRNNGRRKD